MEEATLWSDLLRLLLVLLLVLANGFFVAAEFSLVSVRKTRIAELAALGHPAAHWVQRAIENPDNVIAATQLGITLASLGLGWIGEPALSHLILPLIELFPASVQSGISHSLSAAISFGMITFLHVVAGELAPKSIALQDPEKTSLLVARPTVFSEVVFKPAIVVLNGAGNALLRLVGVQPASGHQLVHSVEELKMIVSASAEGGAVEEDESEMLHAIFDLSGLMVRQVMIPRTEIVAVEADTPLDQVVDLGIENTYTKFPVYEDDLDQILGVIHLRDVMKAMRNPDQQNCTARDLLREAIFMPESISVSKLLREFRDKRQHIAIVLDEFGGTAGLATLEDLLEEIVGEVSDPFDTTIPEVEMMPDGTQLIDGLTLIDDVNNQLGLLLVEPDYDTIAGYILGKLGRIPKLNDVVEGDGVRLQVVAMDGMRIERVSLERLPKDKPPAPETESELE
ncbi:MAG: hemolysin family protein [Anaerolineales bacterium]|jgi:CBS domain containing-hemolysin-like protein